MSSFLALHSPWWCHLSGVSFQSPFHLAVCASTVVVLLVVSATVRLCQREVDPYSLPPPSGDLASVSPCCGMWLVHSLASWHPGVYVVVCGSALLQTRGALASPSFWPSGG